ncbi:hypothetical protein GCM10010271_02770 [Streptomyces kurssanovii]|nr:hypothetical protein GCM10010271_02770 [Streptomyces kurssanovii]
MLGEGVEGGGDAGPAFRQGGVAPGAVLVERGAYGPSGGGRVQPGRAGDGALVDGAGGGEGAAVRMPPRGPEVEDAVVPERFGGDGGAALPGVGPGRARLEGEGGCHEGELRS